MRVLSVAAALPSIFALRTITASSIVYFFVVVAAVFIFLFIVIFAFLQVAAHPFTYFF